MSMSGAPSSTLTRRSSRSRSANYGLRRSPCASSWSRISDASPSASSTAATSAARLTRSPTICLERRPPRPDGSALVDQLGPATPSDALALQLIHRLRDQSPAITAMLARLDERLAAEGRTTDSAIHDEQQRQISANVTVRNIITSMRHISDVDWADIFERVSLVDPVLAEGCDFAEMDFATRNLYRTAVEELARGSGLDELEVANRAVRGRGRRDRAAPQGSGLSICPPRAVRAFEAAMGFRPPSGRSPAAPIARSASAAMSAPAPSSPRCCSASRSSSMPRPAWTGSGWACSGRSARCRRWIRRWRWSTRGDPPVRRHAGSRASSFATACPPICARWWSCRRC